MNMLNHIKYDECNENNTNNFNATIINIIDHLKYKWYMDSSALNHVIGNTNVLESIYKVKGRLINMTREKPH